MNPKVLLVKIEAGGGDTCEHVALDALREIALDDTRAGYRARRALKQIEAGQGTSRSTLAPEEGMIRSESERKTPPAPATHEAIHDHAVFIACAPEGCIPHEEIRDHAKAILVELERAGSTPAQQAWDNRLAKRDARIATLTRERDEALREVKLRVHGMDVAQQQRDEARAENETLRDLLREAREQFAPHHDPLFDRIDAALVARIDAVLLDRIDEEEAEQ